MPGIAWCGLKRPQLTIGYLDAEGFTGLCDGQALQLAAVSDGPCRFTEQTAVDKGGMDFVGQVGCDGGRRLDDTFARRITEEAELAADDATILQVKRLAGFLRGSVLMPGHGMGLFATDAICRHFLFERLGQSDVLGGAGVVFGGIPLFRFLLHVASSLA